MDKPTTTPTFDPRDLSDHFNAELSRIRRAIVTLDERADKDDQFVVNAKKSLQELDQKMMDTMEFLDELAIVDDVAPAASEEEVLRTE